MAVDVFYDYNGEPREVRYGSGDARESEYAPYGVDYLLCENAVDRDGNEVEVYAEYAFETDEIMCNTHSHSKDEEDREEFERAKFWLADTFIDVDEFGREEIDYEKMVDALGSQHFNGDNLDIEALDVLSWPKLVKRFLQNAEEQNVDASRFDFSATREYMQRILLERQSRKHP